MPVTVHTPEPCKKQADLMRSLGFECHDSESDEYCPWALPLNAEASKVFRLRLHIRAEPTLQEIALKIARQAFKQGQKDIAKALNTILELGKD